MEIKKLETKRSDSAPIMNSAKVLSSIVDIQTKAFEEGKKSLSSNLINELTAVFGKYTDTYTSEHRHRIWVLQYKDLVFNIYSSVNGGTSIEVCGMTYEQLRKGERVNDIIEFLHKLYSVLN